MNDHTSRVMAVLLLLSLTMTILVSGCIDQKVEEEKCPDQNLRGAMMNLATDSLAKVQANSTTCAGLISANMNLKTSYEYLDKYCTCYNDSNVCVTLPVVNDTIVQIKDRVLICGS